VTVQFIEEHGRRRFAVLPIEEYEALREAAEMLADVAAYDRAKAAGGDTLPAAAVDRLIAGEAPLRVLREHRGLTQKGLAEACGVTKAYVAQLESGARSPSTRLLQRLAAALAVGVADLV
jgi:DNA-binding XRE family transcriptional regulator